MAEVGEIPTEPLPGGLGNKGSRAYIFRKQGILPIYFQGSRELEEKRQCILGILGKGFGEQVIFQGDQHKKILGIKGTWTPPHWDGLRSGTSLLFPFAFPHFPAPLLFR